MKKYILNGMLIIVSVFVALVLVEIVLRVFLPQQLVARGRHTYHPVLGWKNIPGASYLMQSRDFNVMVNINEMGFRGKENILSNNTLTKKVLILGDSFALGWGVEDNVTFPAILGEMLGDKYQVINTGVINYGTDQELLFLKTEGINYSPDIVVLLFCPNDIQNNMVDFYQKPHFSLDESVEGGLALQNVPVPHVVLKESFLSKLKSKLKANLHLYALFSKTLRLVRYRYLHSTAVDKPGMIGGNEKEQNSLGISTEGQVAYFPWLKKWPDKSNHAWRLTTKMIESMHNIALSNNARFLLVVIPYKEELSREAWQRSIDIYDLDPSQYQLNKLAGLFRIFSSENNIETILLRDHFKEKDIKELYFQNDGHWTPYGNRIVAEILYQNIVGISTIDTPNKKIYRTRLKKDRVE